MPSKNTKKKMKNSAKSTQHKKPEELEVKATEVPAENAENAGENAESAVVETKTTEEPAKKVETKEEKQEPKADKKTNAKKQAKKPSKIATIPIGYADGIARNLSNRMFGLLNGKMVKQVGNISMDQIMFDITNVEACVGDVITLLGQDGEDFFSIDEWAKILNTINFELVCRLKVRLPRIYTR